MAEYFLSPAAAVEAAQTLAAQLGAPVFILPGEAIPYRVRVIPPESGPYQAVTPAGEVIDHSAPESPANLPSICAWTEPLTGATILIKRGETGFWRLREDDHRKAAEINQELGVSPSVARAMFMGSMFGWDVPAADPALYWTEDPCFYVSILDGSTYLLAAGPFRTHAEALELVPLVEEIAGQVDPRAPFWAYGTCKAPDGKKEGASNEVIAAHRLAQLLRDILALPV